MKLTQIIKTEEIPILKILFDRTASFLIFLSKCLTIINISSFYRLYKNVYTISGDTTMILKFIIIFMILAVTLIVAVIAVKIIRPGNKKEDVSLGSWDASNKEKRKHPRIDVNWPVSLETSTGTQKAMVRNIGIGGAFVICDNPLPLNEITRMTIETPLEQSLELNGKAIWTNISVRDDKVVNKGMRIQFVHNSSEDLKLLHQTLIVASQQPLDNNEKPNKTGDYENRRDARIDISWPVEMETSQGKLEAETRHVSVGGAFIVCEDPLPLNEQFHIIIHIPKDKHVSANAEVVWSNINVPEDQIVNRGMGIRFINITKEDLKPLSEALMKIVSDSFNPKD